jgi:hypothetical protein
MAKSYGRGRRRTLAAVVALPLVLLLAQGCGRRATEADCDLIVDRYVEIQLKTMNINDPATIEKQKTEQRTAMKDELHDCIGKRVTDGMLACVKKAQTNDEIDKCVH